MENKELYRALSKARSEFPALIKDQKGGKGKYIKFPDVLGEVVPILKSNGLYLEQPTIWKDGFVLLNTKIRHVETGQYTESFFPLTIDESATGVSKDQKEGGTQTYHKRYQLFNLLGICGEDDDNDGNYQNDSPKGNSPNGNVMTGLASEPQLRLLKSLLKPETEKFVLEDNGITSLSQLSKQVASDLIKSLKGE